MIEEPCKSCGAKCCRAPSYVVVADGGFHLPQPHGRCIFLNHNACSIYENRPKMCRDMVPDGPACKAAIERAFR